MRKYLMMLVAAGMMAGMMMVSGCGGGGGGSDAPPVVNVTAADNGTTANASAADYTYRLAAGTYTYNISNFTTGDKLDFPALPAGSYVMPDTGNCATGNLGLIWHTGTQDITVTLTGLNSAACSGAYDVDHLATLFGTGWLL